jgi:hypothetical protein
MKAMRIPNDPYHEFWRGFEYRGSVLHVPTK